MFGSFVKSLGNFIFCKHKNQTRKQGVQKQAPKKNYSSQIPNNVSSTNEKEAQIDKQKNSLKQDYLINRTFRSEEEINNQNQRIPEVKRKQVQNLKYRYDYSREDSVVKKFIEDREHVQSVPFMNSSMQGQQYTTKYLFTRLGCAKLLQKSISPNQKSFDQQASKKIIKLYLKQMKQQYKYKISLQEQVYSKQKIMRRKVKLRYRCQNCSKNFSSIVGLFEIYFKFQLNTEKQLQLQYQCKIYQMKCQSCLIDCKGEIFTSQLIAVSRKFCLLLAEIIQQVPVPQYVDNRHKSSQVHNHRQDLCEACQNGVCFARPQGNRQIKESKKYIHHDRRPNRRR